MALINQPPRLQLGDAPLAGYAGSETDQVTLVWQTTGSLTGDTFDVEYRSAGDAWNTVTTHTSFDTGVGSRVMHEAEIDGLAYDSTYEYRVTHTPSGGSPVVYQASFDTRLEAGDTGSFTFAAYGDSADPNSLAPFIEVQDQIAAYDPDFALLLGDNAYNNGTHAEFDARFASGVTSPGTLQWIASSIDYPAYGNHDHNSGGGGYRDGYAVPVPDAGVNGPVDNPAGMTPELNYSFDYGDAHFVTFDSNKLNSASQLDTLLTYVEADLTASDAQWNIVFAHHPVGGAPDKGEGPEDNYWKQVVPRLHDAGVDLFLTGHSHTYSWTYPLTGYSGNNATFVQDTDNIYDQGDGLVQVVAGTGGRGLRSGNFGYDFVAQGFSTSTQPAADYGFARISVSASELVVDYVMSDDGSILDTFRIVTDGSGSGGQDGGNPGGTLLTFQNGNGSYDAAADTYVRQASPDVSYGNATAINVDSSDGGGQMHGLVRFGDLFGEDDGQVSTIDTILSATLYLDVFNPGNAMQLHEMLGAWTESDTWNSLSAGIQADGTEAAAAAVATTGAVNSGVLAIDVTASVTGWQANPTANHGWALLPTGSDGVDFNASETATGPRLVVEVEEAPPAGTALSFEQNTDGYSGVADTHVPQATPGTSYGSANALNIDGSDGGGPVQGLIRFDSIFGAAAGQVGTGDSILSATLYLDVFDPGDSFGLYEMLGTWSEADSWNSLSGGIQADGVEAKTSAAATTGPVDTGLLAIDVTASLAAWQADPSANHGWALLPAGTNGVDFSSSETANGPRLVVIVDDDVPPPNTPPVAGDDTFSADEDATVSGNLLANDSDPDGDTPTVSQVAGQSPGTILLPSGAQVTVDAAGAMTYDPNGAFDGLIAGETASDSFDYQIDDGNGGTDTATVNVTIDGVGAPPAVVIGEAGTLTFKQGADSNWHTVSFTETIPDASVVMGPISYNASTPATVRVKNVTDTGFEFQIDEWDYLDGWHNTESVSWLAASEGVHLLSNGVTIAAGEASANGSAFSSIGFGHDFGSAPVVIAQAASVNDPNAVTTRLDNVSATGFDAFLDEQEANPDDHAAETLSWVAIEQYQGTLDDGLLLSSTAANITHKFSAIGVDDADWTELSFLAEMQTFAGPNTANLRYRDSGGYQVQVDEEQSADYEVKHIGETVGFIGMETGLLYA